MLDGSGKFAHFSEMWKRRQPSLLVEGGRGHCTTVRLLNAPFLPVNLYLSVALASPAMGHWGTCPPSPSTSS